jgi:hypothetical protein
VNVVRPAFCAFERTSRTVESSAKAPICTTKRSLDGDAAGAAATPLGAAAAAGAGFGGSGADLGGGGSATGGSGLDVIAADDLSDAAAKIVAAVRVPA